MIYIKIKILYKFNSFIFNTMGYQYTKNIANVRENTRKLLNQYLNDLILLQNKKIYYSGYDNTTSILNTTNIFPHNILDDPNPFIDDLTPKMSGLLVY